MTLDLLGLDILTLDILGLDVLTLDILGLDILTLDILGLDILTLDILGIIPHDMYFSLIPRLSLLFYTAWNGMTCKAREQT